jgi:hypothetical protein
MRYQKYEGPQITFLSPSAIGCSIRPGERIFKLPVKLVEPVFPAKLKE